MKKLNTKILVSIISIGASLTQISPAIAQNQDWEISGNKTKHYYGLVEKKVKTKDSLSFFEVNDSEYQDYLEYTRNKEREQNKKSQEKINRYKKSAPKDNYISLSLGTTNLDRENYSATYTNNGTPTDVSGNYDLPGENGSSLRFAFGSKLNSRTRFELSVTKTEEITELSNDGMLELSTELFQYMAGLEFDLLKSNKFSMFIGGGAGISKINSLSKRNSAGQVWEDNKNLETDISWEAKVGGKIELTNQFEIFGAYVYSNAGTQKWENEGLESGSIAIKHESEADLIAQKVEVGIRYKF